MKIEAQQRLESQRIYDHPLISHTMSDIECEHYEKILVNTKYTDLGTKNGIQMLWIKEAKTRSIILRTGSAVIGYLMLAPASTIAAYKEFKNYWIVALVYIKEAYRGLKLGTVLHLGACHEFNKIISDIDISKTSMQTFRSIEKYGYTLGLFNTDTGKKLTLVWGSDDLPQVGGKSIDVLDDYFVIYTK